MKPTRNIEQLLPEAGVDIILSIQREHANRLYRGQKSFELRKHLPRRVPRRMFLCEVDSGGAITGHVIVESVWIGSPENVWEATGERGTTQERFWTYFAGRSVAYAIEIGVAVKYSSPLRLRDIAAGSGLAKGVQSFAYADADINLSNALNEKAFDEASDTQSDELLLRRIARQRRTAFLDAVEKHISDSYLETGRTYGEKLLHVSDAGRDVEGVFTLRKRVLDIVLEGRPIGFAVLTEKLGGSVKTGPVILDKAQRDHGVGRELRSALHVLLKRYGSRKIYATVPESNIGAWKYLLGSGYRIEAQLARQYHGNHDEFVFGFPLENYYDLRERMPIRHGLPLDAFGVVDKPDGEVIGLLREGVSNIFEYVPEWWIEQQAIALLDRQNSVKRPFKDRIAFFAQTAGRTEAMALCLPKRGGAAKLWIFTRTAHVGSIVEFIEWIVEYWRVEGVTGVRRLYGFVPSHDISLETGFRLAGFDVEGYLRKPYAQHADYLVFGKG